MAGSLQLESPSRDHSLQSRNVPSSLAIMSSSTEREDFANSVLCINEELNSLALEKNQHQITKSQYTPSSNKSPSPSTTPQPPSNINISLTSYSQSKSQPTHSSPDNSAEVTYRNGRTNTSGGWFDGILGCLRPVWTIIGKAAINENKNQDIASVEIVSIPAEAFLKTQATWKQEVEEQMEKIQANGNPLPHLEEAELVKKRREELRHAQDVREHYEKKLERANNLYLELSACLLQLEQRERDIIKREQELQAENSSYKPYKRRIVRPLLKAQEKLNKKRSYKVSQESSSPLSPAKTPPVSVDQSINSPSYHQTKYRSRRCRHRRSHSGSGSYSSGGGSNTNSPSGERKRVTDSGTQTEPTEVKEADSNPYGVVTAFKTSRTQESVSEMSDTPSSSDKNWTNKSNNRMCTSSSASSDECRDRTPVSDKRLPCLPPTPEETEDTNMNEMSKNSENNGNSETIHNIPTVLALNNMPVIDEENTRIEPLKREIPPMPVISRRQMRSTISNHRRHPVRCQEAEDSLTEEEEGEVDESDDSVLRLGQRQVVYIRIGNFYSSGGSYGSLKTMKVREFLSAVIKRTFSTINKRHSGHSYSTLSSEGNLSEEGEDENTSEYSSHVGTPCDLLSSLSNPDIPRNLAEAQAIPSDGLSDKEHAVSQVKAQSTMSAIIDKYPLSSSSDSEEVSDITVAMPRPGATNGHTTVW
ncbi:Mitogen-activated protein kinase kinase kinase 12 [Nymphon striatum]|nr:Mitogen-activated protein kinase kinase kinase 12 [Nymphon striatum]